MSEIISNVAHHLSLKGITAQRLDLTDEHVGGTGYIDSLDYETFGKGVFYGLDPSGRAYVSFPVREMTTDNSDEPEDKVIVMFKRYTNDNYWVSMTPYSTGDFVDVLNEVVAVVFQGKEIDSGVSCIPNKKLELFCAQV